MKKLIVNADDFGISELTNKGIIHCFRDGILTSTTLMANGNAFDNAVRLAKAHNALGVGVHLNLTQGKPVSAAFEGKFSERNIYKAMFSMLNLRDVETEFRAQIEKIIKGGIRPTHIDGHKHIHIFPGIIRIVVKLAREYGIRAIRLPKNNKIVNYRLILTWQMPKLMLIEMYARTAERIIKHAGLATAGSFYGVLETGRLDKGYLAAILEKVKEGPAELMCHPGFYDENIPCVLKKSRETELQALTDKRIKSKVASENLRLINYGQLVPYSLKP